MKERPQLMRVDPEFKKMIRFIQAKYIKEGKKPPSANKLTKHIANIVNKDKILQDVYIKF